MILAQRNTSLRVPMRLAINRTTLSANFAKTSPANLRAFVQERAYCSTPFSRLSNIVHDLIRSERPKDFDVLPQIMENSRVKFAEKKCLGTRVGDGYEWITYAEFGHKIAKLRRVLNMHKIERGDKVALISNNRVEWATAMYAVTGVGAQLVPMYEAQLESDWKYIINDSDAKMAFLESVLSFDADEQYMHSYKKWMKLAENEPDVPIVSLRPSELSTIIYTSGTTGKPKGVELSHENVVANLQGLDYCWQDRLDHMTSLAFLPWSHVFGQTAELHSLLALGSSLGIVSKREEILEALPMIKPSVIMTWLNFKHSIADKVVLSKIRDRLGGNLKMMAAGGAATSLTVLQFFEDIGIPICEGYGLTETSPVIACGSNDWQTRRLGTVGVPLFNNIVRIVDPQTLEERPLGEEGEIVQAGPNVMTGYRNNEEANAEVFFVKDGHRFFRTGDLGRMVDGKFLQVTGRIKEQFKLENGKYVVPAPLEDAITRSQFIGQCFMHGENKPFTAVLIVPDPIEMAAWAQKNGFEGMLLEDLVKEQKVIDFMHQEIVSACGVLKAYERPKKFTLIGTPFSPDNQMLTAKLSMRRNNILKVHGDVVEEMFVGGGHDV
eukprot:GSChrysophyteH1.ASY1.ANO1.1364.1 assembled CDS